MRGVKIASRYARSLLLLSVERNQLDKAYADVMSIHQVIASSKDLQLLLQSPVVKGDVKIRILSKIFSETGELVGGFFKLLTDKGREALLPAITQSFIEQVKKFRNITTAEVISAVPLDGETKKRVEVLAASIAGGVVDLNAKVSADIIGGFVLKIGDLQIDRSIASEINNLKRDFEKNPFVANL
jgi:F-type H+-transporting ATPase subunit delta